MQFLECGEIVSPYLSHKVANQRYIGVSFRTTLLDVFDDRNDASSCQ